jgi:hypothetical protein
MSGCVFVCPGGHIVVAPAVLALACLVGETGLSAQAPPVIKGPPPPIAPEVMTRDAEGRATVRAFRLPLPLRFDGRLDEAFYQTTPPITGFYQTLPNPGEASTQKTEVWVADINAANDLGNTALHAAAMAGFDSVAQFLVDRGAQLNPQNKNGETPLRLADGYIADTMLYVRSNTAKLLRTLGASAD